MFWPRRFAGGLGLGVALCAVAAPYAGHARGSTPTALTASDSVGRSGASAVPVATTVRARCVPNEYPTIQAAVDAARPGDLVLIAPGVYREIVTVTTPLLVLRGTDRNATIIDAEFARRDGIVVRADGVAVENLTVQHALGNGVVLDGVTGWRASYLTAIRNGDHGIFARGATDGLVEASHVSGSSVAGIAIEACRPCRTIVRHVTAEYNAAGYRGRDAEGVRVVASLVRRNRAGLAGRRSTRASPPT